jgi:hydrogenase maturation factor
VDRDLIPLADVARAACEVFGTDPWWTLSEGTLIATVRPEHAGAVLGALTDEGLEAAEIGEVTAGSGKLLVWTSEGPLTLTEPQPDPYWPAYKRAVDEGWK